MLKKFQHGVIASDKSIDVRATDSEALLYEERSVQAVLALADGEKSTSIYLEAAEACQASFTPFVQSLDGALGK